MSPLEAASAKADAATNPRESPAGTAIIPATVQSLVTMGSSAVTGSGAINTVQPQPSLTAHMGFGIACCASLCISKD